MQWRGVRAAAVEMNNDRLVEEQRCYMCEVTGQRAYSTA